MKKVDCYEKILRDLGHRVGATDQRLIGKALEQVSSRIDTRRRGHV